LLVIVACAAVTACGGGGGGGGGSAASDGVEVGSAWARASVPGQTVGAVYFEIESASTDTLLAASVPASVAGDVELHRSAVDDDQLGAMGEVEGGLVLAAGDTVSFEPGGLHVMLVDLVAPLVPGASLPLTLEFAKAAPLMLDVPIAETPP
jgi:copper(I)-binding protein